MDDMQSGPDPDDPVEPGGPATGTEYVEKSDRPDDVETR